VDNEPPEFEDDEDEIRLGQLEDEMRKGEQWSRDDQEWLIRTLRSTREELEAEKAAPFEEAAENSEER
jgi:hypothetical protein